MAEDDTNREMTEEEIALREAAIKSWQKFMDVQNRFTGEYRDSIAKTIAELKKHEVGTKQHSILQNKMIKDAKKEFNDLNDSVKKTTKSTNEFFNSAANLTKVINATKDASEKATLSQMRNTALFEGALQEASKTTREFTSKLASATLTGTGQFVKGLQANASATKLTAGVMNSALDAIGGTGAAIGDALTSAGAAVTGQGKGMAQAIGGVTMAIGAVTKGVSEAGTKLAKFANEIASAEVEKTVTAFNTMSSSGAMFADGMTGMRQAAKDAGVSVDIFAGIVKGSSEKLAASGMSVAEGTKFVGAVMQKGGTNMKNQLLKLGYGFEEHGALVADVIELMRQSSSAPLKATSTEVAEETKKYAENLRIITAVTGEDAKKKMEQAQNSANQLLFQQKLAGMDETQRANVVKAMANMSTQQQKDFRDMVNFGSIINKTGAVMAGQNEAYARSIAESAALAVSGGLDDEKQRQINAKNNEAIQQGWLNATGIANAGAANLGGLGQDVAEAMSDDLQYRKKTTKEGYEAGKKAVKEQEHTNDGLTNSVMEAETAAMGLKVALQEVLTPAITHYAEISIKLLEHIKSMMDDMDWDEVSTSGKETGDEKGFFDKAKGWLGFGAPEGSVQAEGKFGQKMTPEQFEAARIPKTAGGEATRKIEVGETFKQAAPKLMERVMADFQLTKEQAAGLVGNLGHESAGLKAGIQEKNPLGGGRGGLGWAQWTGSRRVGFENYLKETGQSATDPEANYGFLKRELQTTHKGALSALRGETSTEGAMKAFEQKYEAAGVKHYESRMKYAQEALKATGDQQPSQEVEGAPQGPKKSGVLAQASSMLGMNEKNSAKEMTDYLNKYSGTTFKSIAGDMNAWCARFVNATLQSQGIKGTGTASAADFKKYGEGVWDPSKGNDLSGVKAGDIVTMGRKGGSGSHVAIVKGVNPETGKVEYVGGNQGGEKQGGGGVTEGSVDISNIQAIRRAPGAGEEQLAQGETPQTGTPQAPTAQAGLEGEAQRGTLTAQPSGGGVQQVFVVGMSSNAMQSFQQNGQQNGQLTETQAAQAAQGQQQGQQGPQQGQPQAQDGGLLSGLAQVASAGLSGVLGGGGMGSIGGILGSMIPGMKSGAGPMGGIGGLFGMSSSGVAPVGGAGGILGQLGGLGGLGVTGFGGQGGGLEQIASMGLSGMAGGGGTFGGMLGSMIPGFKSGGGPFEGLGGLFGQSSSGVAPAGGVGGVMGQLGGIGGIMSGVTQLGGILSPPQGAPISGLQASLQNIPGVGDLMPDVPKSSGAGSAAGSGPGDLFPESTGGGYMEILSSIERHMNNMSRSNQQIAKNTV